jgi:hypothetical protein
MCFLKAFAREEGKKKLKDKKLLEVSIVVPKKKGKS